MIVNASQYQATLAVQGEFDATDELTSLGGAVGVFAGARALSSNPNLRVPVLSGQLANAGVKARLVPVANVNRAQMMQLQATVITTFSKF